VVPFREIRYASDDGLKLYARDYGGGEASGLPVLCLAGLTRNSKDFEPVLPVMVEARRVITMDYRGRGRSDYAGDPSTYRPDVEARDALMLLDVLDVPHAGILGTSRGGVVAMAMAAMAPERVSGIMFNDIGPFIETRGLIRIRRNIEDRPDLGSWQDAIHRLKATTPGFETLSDVLWERMARAIFRDEQGIPSYDYDPELKQTFPSASDIETGKVPALWGFFEKLRPMPLAVLRGENSDLLSQGTVNGMIERQHLTEGTVVRHRGHVPLLDEPESIAAILRWLDRLDQLHPS
jgi:pimeloyl-ACP methyl ester carboxylesterase